MPAIPTLEQEAYHEFQASLCYIVNSRLSLVTEEDPVSKHKTNTPWINTFTGLPGQNRWSYCQNREISRMLKNAAHVDVRQNNEVC